MTQLAHVPGQARTEIIPNDVVDPHLQMHHAYSHFLSAVVSRDLLETIELVETILRPGCETKWQTTKHV